MFAVLRAVAFMRRYWKLTALAFGSLTAATLLSLVVPQVLRDVVDQGLPQPLPQMLFTPRFLSDGLGVTLPHPDLIFKAAVLLLGLGVVRAGVVFGQRFFGERLSHYVGYDVRNAFYDKVQHLPFAYHDQSQMGDIITRAITDVDSIRTFLAQGLLDGINVSLIVIGVVVAMLSLNVPLTLVALIPIPLIMLVAIRMGLIQLRNWTELMKDMSALSNLLEENVIGMTVLKAFNREQAESKRWAGINENLYYGQVRFTETWSTYFPLMTFLVATSTALMLWQGGPLVLNHTISIGTIVALDGYILLLGLPVQRLGYVVQQLSSASSSARRVFQIIDEPVVLPEKSGALELPRIEGFVRFEDVSLTYRKGTTESLHNVTFETKPDQVIGLVGPTGSGKSSIINLIPRFYDPTSGRVTIDGHDLRDVTLASLRHQIGMVLQETLLFTATVRENVAFGNPDATMDDVITAAKAADAHRFISELPEGYETKIGERGVTLSGGQRQRIAIARALLLQPRILILDDATSSVDTRTENSIQEALNALMKGRLTFVVAQRLTSIRHADLILVIDRGRVVDRGTHDELIARAGLYQDIYRVQMEDQERLRRHAEPVEQTQETAEHLAQPGD
ncbi:MAG: ABC transporter ATP-binding protein [Aggregatilineales bacterium]